MNVVPVEKLKKDLGIGIEKRDLLILRSVAIAAESGAFNYLLRKKEIARSRYLAIEAEAKKEIENLIPNLINT